MRRMRSPTPGRSGKRDVHSVPSRKVGMLQAKGWELVDEVSPSPVGESSIETGPDLVATHRGGGYYQVTRGDEVVAESVPRSQAQAMGAQV